MKEILDGFRSVNRYIKRYLWKFMLLLTALYVLATVVSLFVMYPKMALESELILDKLREIYLVDRLAEKEGLALSWALFTHNLRVVGMDAMSGVVPFVFLPVIKAVYNGALGGVVYALMLATRPQMFLPMFLKFVLPHSIFELTACCLGGALGMNACLLITKRIFGKAKDEKLKYHYMKFAEILCLYIIPLLLLAAFLEGYVEWVLFD